MKLIVHELITNLYQEVKADKITQVEAIRVNLYKHNLPAGIFSLEIRNSRGHLIAVSDSEVNASDISAVSYYHGLIRFNISVQLQKNVTYRVVLRASGYTFSEDAYIGWCSAFDLKSYDLDYQQTSYFNAPLSLEIWERSTR